MKKNKKKYKVSRNKNLLNKLVIVDGQPGCGKTLFSPIISCLKNAELMTYLFEVEFITRIYELGKISLDSAETLIKLFVDQKLYNHTQGREVNFRFSDLSSVFRHPEPSIYFNRIFGEGDMTVPSMVKKNKPIMNFTTHDLLVNSELLFNIFKKKLIFIEVLRHPLYMLIQLTLNMERLLDNPRDIQVCLNYKNKEIPYYAKGWERKFINSNDVGKAIYLIEDMTIKNNLVRNRLNKRNEKNLITIYFEDFVHNPNKYLKIIQNIVGNKFSNQINNILKKHKIPRKKIADGIDLAIYRRCGWKPPIEDFNEEQELNLRRNFAIKNKVSKHALNTLDRIAHDYEKNFYKNTGSNIFLKKTN